MANEHQYCLAQVAGVLGAIAGLISQLPSYPASGASANHRRTATTPIRTSTMTLQSGASSYFQGASPTSVGLHIQRTQLATIPRQADVHVTPKRPTAVRRRREQIHTGEDACRAILNNFKRCCSSRQGTTWLWLSRSWATLCDTM